MEVRMADEKKAQFWVCFKCNLLFWWDKVEPAKCVCGNEAPAVVAMVHND